jgi:hypothetical protein
VPHKDNRQVRPLGKGPERHERLPHFPVVVRIPTEEGHERVDDEEPRPHLAGRGFNGRQVSRDGQGFFESGNASQVGSRRLKA